MLLTPASMQLHICWSSWPSSKTPFIAADPNSREITACLWDIFVPQVSGARGVRACLWLPFAYETVIIFPCWFLKRICHYWTYLYFVQGS